MSEEEKKRFVKRILAESVCVKSIKGRVRLNDMFSRFSSAVVVIKRKDGTLESYL